MNKEVPKCKGCSRRRKSSDDIPSEVIYLYCKPCCKPGTIHKTKCCEKCSIFDSVPMCRRPSSDINLQSAGYPLNIELLPGYDEPSNKIDRKLRELFNCEDDTKSDEEILSNLIEDAKGASVEPNPASFQPVLNNSEDRTNWMKKLMKGEMSKEVQQPREGAKSKSPKSERTKNTIENTTSGMFPKSKSWDKSEFFSMSSADSTKMRAFLDLQIPENYEEFKPLKIPAEWKKPIETNESIIWKTAISNEASNLVNKEEKAKETKSTPKPAEFRKSGDSESTKGQIPTKARKVGKEVKPNERKISDEIKNSSTRNSINSRKSENIRKPGDGIKPGYIQKFRNETKLSGTKPERTSKSGELPNLFTPKSSNHANETKKIMSVRSISFSTSSEEAVQTPRISERKKFKERKLSGGSVVPEIKPHEENPKSGEFRNFPYSTIAQNKLDNVKDRVEEFRNFGTLENLSSSNNFKEARTTQEIEKIENLKILTDEWYKPQKSIMPTDIKKSAEELGKEQKKFEEMQKIIELISFLSKTSETESEDEESLKWGQDKLRELKQSDQFKEFKKTDDHISSEKATQAEVFPEHNGEIFIDLINSTETLKSAQFEMPLGGEQSKDWGALAKVKNSKEKLPREVEDIKKNELFSINSAHKLDEALTIAEEIQSKMVGELKRTEHKREQTAEVETKYENLPESENFWNFVRLRALEEGEYSHDLTDTEELIEERKFDELQSFEETSSVEAKKTSTYDDQLEEIKNSEMEPAIIWSDVSQLEDLRKSESLKTLEQIKNGEMEPPRTWSDVSQLEELRKCESLEMLDQIRNSEMEPARIWSDVSQLEELRKSESLEMIDQIKNSEIQLARIWSDVSQLEELRKFESLTMLDQIKNSEMESARIWSDVSQLEEIRKSESLEMLDRIKNSEMEPARIWSDVSQLKEIRKSESLEMLDRIKNSEREPARTWSDVSQLEELRKSESLKMLDQIKYSEMEPVRIWSDMSQFPVDWSKQAEIQRTEGLKSEGKVKTEDVPVYRESSNLNRFAITEQARTAQDLGIPVVCEIPRWKRLKPDNMENKCICSNTFEHPRNLAELSKFEYRTDPNWRKTRKLKMSDEAFKNLKDPFKGLERQREIPTSELTTTSEVTQSCECEEVERWKRYRYDKGRFVICSKEPRKSTKLTNPVDIGKPVKYRKYGAWRVSSKTWKEIKKTEKIKMAKKIWNVIHLTRSEDKSSQKDRKAISNLRKMPKYIPASCSTDTRMSSFDSIKFQDWGKPKKRRTAGKKRREIGKSEQLRKPAGFEKLEGLKGSQMSASAEIQLSDKRRSHPPANAEEKGAAIGMSQPEQPDLLNPVNLIMAEEKSIWTDVSQHEELMKPEDYYKHALRESGIQRSRDIQSSDLRDSDVSSILKTKLSWTDISQFEEITGSEALETLEYLKEKEKFVSAEKQGDDSRLSVNSSMAEAKRTSTDLSQPEEVRELKELQAPPTDFNIDTKMKKSHEEMESERNQSTGQKVADLWKVSSRSEIYRFTDIDQSIEQIRALEDLNISKDMKYSNDELERGRNDLVQTQPTHLGDISQTAGSEIMKTSLEISQLEEFRKAENFKMSESMRNAGRSTASLHPDLSSLLSNSEVKKISADKRRRSENELNKSLKRISQSKRLRNQLNSKSLSEQIYSGETEKSAIWGNPKAWRKVRDIELYGKVQNSKDEIEEEIENLSKSPTNLGEKRISEEQKFEDWSNQGEIHGSEESEYKAETEDVPGFRELSNSNRFAFSEQARTAQELEIPVVCEKPRWKQVEPWKTSDLVKVNKCICSKSSYQTRSLTEVTSCEPEDIKRWERYRYDKGRSVICLKEPSKLSKFKNTVVIGKSVKYRKYGTWRVSSKTQKEIEIVEKIKMAKKIWNVIYLASSDDKSNEEDRESISSSPKMPKCMLPSCSTDTKISSFDSIKRQDWRKPKEWGTAVKKTGEINKSEQLRKSERFETPERFKETEMLASAELRTPDLLQPVYLIMAEAKRIWTDVSQNEELMEPEDYDIRELEEGGICRTSSSQPKELKEQLSLKAPQGSEDNEIKKYSEIRESKDWGTPWASASLQVKKISSSISQSAKPRAPPADFNIYKEINISTDINQSIDSSEEKKFETWSKQAEIQRCEGWKSECRCEDAKPWVRYRDDEGCSIVCLKEPRKSTKLKNPVEIGKPVKYRKYGTWRVSSKTWKELEKTEKTKMAKEMRNVIHLTCSEDKSSQEDRKSISSLRKMPKYIPASCSTDTRISSFDSIKLQDWGKPKKCENHEKKINKGTNKSAILPKNGKVCYCFRSTTSDERTTSIENLKGILERRRRANLKSNTTSPQGGREEETNSEYEKLNACTCSISPEELENPTGARKTAGKEVFSVLGDNSGLTMSDEVKNIDCGIDKEVPEAQTNLKSGELLYYFRAPSSEDARNSIMKQFGGAKNRLVDNQSGHQIKCVSLVKCNKLGTLKYWAIPRHLNIPGNLANLESFGSGKLEKLGKSNDFEKLDDRPIILKGSPHQEKSNGSVVVDIGREVAICERNCEVKNEEKTVVVNAEQCVNNLTNAQMYQGIILKNEEICDQQDLTKQEKYFNLELTSTITKDSQDRSVGCQISEGQLRVDGLSKQSLTKEHKLDTTAQMDNDKEIMLIERMSGGGEINNDTEEEEEEEVQEEIYDENLCKKKFRKRANCSANAGSSGGCNLSEKNNLAEQPNLEARTIRSDRSNSSNLSGSRLGRSNHGYSRNDTRLYAGKNVRMGQSYSQRGRRDVDNEDVGVVEKVQNVTRRITSSGNVVEVCETVRYAKVFKNSYEDLNPRMEFSNYNPYKECDLCTMPCNTCSFRTNQNSNYSNSCCCRHSDPCSDADPCCCDCDGSSNSDCDVGHAILSTAPSIGYLNKHDEDIVTDKHGMNKPKNFNSEENLSMENTEETYHETAKTSQISSNRSQSSNSCCCDCHRSNSDCDGGCAVLTKAPHLGYLSKHDDNEMRKSSEESLGMEDTAETYHRSQFSEVSFRNSLDDKQKEVEETKQSKDDENDAVELTNQKAKSTSSQVASKFPKGNSIENSGSVAEPGLFNGNNRVLHPNKEFQSAQRKMNRQCNILSGRPCTETGCHILRLGPLIGSRRNQKMPDEMGIMMPTKRIPSYSEFQSKQIDPINLRAGAELDVQRSHMSLAELNAVLANKRNNSEGNNVREAYNRNRITDSRRIEPTRKLNFISEMKNFHRNYRTIGVTNNDRETYAADQRKNFEPDFEPQTYDHHYSPLSDRAAKVHQRRLNIDGRREDLSRFYNNDFSNEESNHFQRKPDAVVNILVDSKGRGQVFGRDVKSVNYSPNNHGATSASIISISTNRRKNLNSIDDRIHYNRERQVRKSRSYEAFQQLSRYEESDELQMRNRRLGGGADQTDFEENECYGNDNRELCCRKRFKPCLRIDMASTPENRTRNSNQRTYNIQKYNEPEMGYCSEENNEQRSGYFSSGMEESGGNIADRRNYFENEAADLQQYRKDGGSDQSITDTDGEPLPEEFVLSQSDLRRVLQNNEKEFYVNVGRNKNRSLELRRQSDTLLETRSREQATRKFINDAIYPSNNNEIFIRRREDDSISPASNNGIKRTYKSQRRHSDHRMDAGGPWEINQHYMDGPTCEYKGKRYISERDDLYINNDFASNSRRNPAFLNVANDNYYIRPGNRQQEVRYPSGRPMPSNIKRTLDENIFPHECRKRRRVQYDTRTDIEEPYPYRSTGEMFDYGRRNAVDDRTYRNEANFDERRNNYIGTCQYLNNQRPAGAEKRYYDRSKQQNGYSRGNIIENRSNDFHLERPDYLRLEFDEDDNVEERIVFDANGNILDFSTQPTFNKNKLHIEADERMSTMHEPLHCYNKKIIHGSDPMFYHRKVLVDPDTSAISVVEEGYVTRLKAGTEKKSKYVFKDERTTKPDEQIICYRKRVSSGRNGNDTDNIERRTRNGHGPQYNNARSSSFENTHYKKLRRESDPKSSKLESRIQREVFDRNCYNRKSSEDTHYKKLKRGTEEPNTNSSKELREKAHRSSKTIRGEKYERNRRDEDSGCCNCDSSRSRKPEAPSSSKRKTNGNREFALVNPKTNDRYYGGVRKSTDFDEQNSANTEESLDKSDASLAPRYEKKHNKETSTSSTSDNQTYKNKEYFSQSRMSDISLVLVEDTSFGNRRVALAEQEEVSYVSRTTSYHERRNSSEEQKLYNNNSYENAKNGNRSPNLSITTYDTSTETERRDNASWTKPERNMTGYSRENKRLPDHVALENSQNYSDETNRRCSQECTHNGCSCKCHTVKKCRMCKCRSKSSGENVSPIFSNWLQQSEEIDNKSTQVNSCESICKQCKSCKSERVQANHNKGPCSCCRCPKIAKHDEPPPRNCKGRCGCADMQRSKENRQYGCCVCPDAQRSRENKPYNWSYDSSLQQANYVTQLPVCNCNRHTIPISQGCRCNIR